MKIIIVEDNEKIRVELKEFLEKYNYEVEVITQFETVVDDIVNIKPHLVLLDINLPVYDGYYICKEVRAKSTIPIIIVTSRDSEIDELMSLNLGADDFITKPYNTQILLAHIVSVLNRTYKKENTEEIEYNGLILNITEGKVIYGKNELELSKNELKILGMLMKNKNAVTKREDIMEKLWQSDEFVDDNTLTVNVNRLRKSLESIGAQNYIKTKRGLGYSL